MKSKMFLLSLGLVAVGLAAPPSPARQPARPATPTSVAVAFYRFHFDHDKSFTERTLASRRRWLTAELFDLLSKELRRPSRPDEAPYLEGDPFTDSQEYPNAFRIAQATVKGDEAEAEVSFFWREKGKVVRTRKHTVVLRREGGGWKLADIRYGENHDFPNLIGLLKRTSDP